MSFVVAIHQGNRMLVVLLDWAVYSHADNDEKYNRYWIEKINDEEVISVAQIGGGWLWRIIWLYMFNLIENDLPDWHG